MRSALLIRELASFFPDRRSHARYELANGWALCFEDEDLIRAQDALDSVAVSRLPVRERPLLLSGLAWCEAKLGNAELALDMSERAVRQARLIGDKALCGVLAVHGALLLRCGRGHEAIAALRESLQRATARPRIATALAAYHLGEALYKAGDFDGARAAWERCIGSPPNRYTLLAHERLAHVVMASPYR